MQPRGRLTPLWILALFGLLAATVWGAANIRAIGRWLYPVYHRDVIEDWAARRGLDPWLVAAVVRVESNFRPTAVSSRGARGLMQLLPDTARWVAEQAGERDFFPDLLFVPEVNVRLGTWYLAELLKEFDGREALALAAYNAGRGNVRRWLAESAWDGTESALGGVPYRETRKFVARVLRLRRIYRWLYGG
ncbi:MAG: lytic transglycosylase domain-containing protein [Bacillota bacterium]